MGGEFEAGGNGLGRMPAPDPPLAVAVCDACGRPTDEAAVNSAKAYAQMSELLEWERQARSTAQAELRAAEAELKRLKAQAVAAEDALHAQAAAAAQDGASAASTAVELVEARQRLAVLEAELEDKAWSGEAQRMLAIARAQTISELEADKAALAAKLDTPVARA